MQLCYSEGTSVNQTKTDIFPNCFYDKETIRISIILTTRTDFSWTSQILETDLSTVIVKTPNERISYQNHSSLYSLLVVTVCISEQLESADEQQHSVHHNYTTRVGC